MFEVQMPEPLQTAKVAKATKGCRSDSTLWNAIKDGTFPPPDIVSKRVRYWKPSTLRMWQDIATAQTEAGASSERRSLRLGGSR